MIRKIIVVLSVLLILSMSMACGGSPKSSPTPVFTATPLPTATPPLMLSQIHISLMSRWSLFAAYCVGEDTDDHFEMVGVGLFGKQHRDQVALSAATGRYRSLVGK